MSLISTVYVFVFYACAYCYCRGKHTHSYFIVTDYYIVTNRAHVRARTRGRTGAGLCPRVVDGRTLGDSLVIAPYRGHLTEGDSVKTNVKKNAQRGWCGLVAAGAFAWAGVWVSSWPHNQGDWFVGGCAFSSVALAIVSLFVVIENAGMY